MVTLFRLNLKNQGFFEFTKNLLEVLDFFALRPMVQIATKMYIYSFSGDDRKIGGRKLEIFNFNFCSTGFLARASAFSLSLRSLKGFVFKLFNARFYTRH